MKGFAFSPYPLALGLFEFSPSSSVLELIPSPI
jgi:hypothetical protein